jgi:DNA-binding NtrC family response regulator
MLEILVVDDEPAVRISVALALEEVGHRVTVVEDGEQALALILTRTFDVGIFDVRLPKLDGLTLFRRMRVESPGTVAIIMTAYATIPDAIAALRAGAYDYVTKPFDPEDLAERVIQPIAQQHALRQALERARSELASRDVGIELVGKSPAAQRVRAQIDTVAQSDAPVLIRGEPGTGKRLVARTIHARGPRRDDPYLSVRCASLAEGMFDRELLGYVRGAFPGATSGYEGCFVAAKQGTLLLEDVHALSLRAQAVLVEALRDATVTPVGTHEPFPVTARVIATTSEDLAWRVAHGTFREDLLRKIGVFEILLPPLRDRLADLPVLFEHFAQKVTRNVPPKVTARAWAKLEAYPFPGNIDELADAVKHAVTLAVSQGAAIDVEHLPAAVRVVGEEEEEGPPRYKSGTLRIGPELPALHERGQKPSR